jgi:hypothetical protein
MCRYVTRSMCPNRARVVARACKAVVTHLTRLLAFARAYCLCVCLRAVLCILARCLLATNKTVGGLGLQPPHTLLERESAREDEHCVR